MKGKFIESREKLAALPQWIKILMLGQVVMCVAMLLCFITVIASVQGQFVALVNLASSLLQHTSDSAATAAQADFRHAIEIGVDGAPWLYGLLAAIVASAVMGGVVVSLTPWKMKDSESVRNRQFRM